MTVIQGVRSKGFSLFHDDFMISGFKKLEFPDLSSRKISYSKSNLRLRNVVGGDHELI